MRFAAEKKRRKSGLSCESSLPRAALFYTIRAFPQPRGHDPVGRQRGFVVLE